MIRNAVFIGFAIGLGAMASGCTDDRNINAATGALAGAAVGTQIGGGSGTVAATLGGAAIGTVIGANAPTSR